MLKGARNSKNKIKTKNILNSSATPNILLAYFKVQFGVEQFATGLLSMRLDSYLTGSQPDISKCSATHKCESAR